jgi:hypothetical protein
MTFKDGVWVPASTRYCICSPAFAKLKTGTAVLNQAKTYKYQIYRWQQDRAGKCHDRMSPKESECTFQDGTKRTLET